MVKLKKILALSASLYLAGISTLLLLFPSNVIAASALKVIVHVNDTGSVCVYSVSEDLGCQFVHGPIEAIFEFSPGMVAINEEFKVCINDDCKTAINGPEKAPVHVYIDIPPEQDEAVLNETNDVDASEDSPDYVPILFAIFGIVFILVVMLRPKKGYERRGFPSLVKKEEEWNHIHVSGHGSGDQIKKIIEGSNSKLVVPVHTEHEEYHKKMA